MKISITPKRQSLRIIWKVANVDYRDMTRNDSPGPVARGVTVFGVLLLVAWSAFGADVKISDLPETNAPSASAVLPIVDNGVTWKVTKQNLLGPSVMVNVPGFLTNNLVGLDPSDPHSSGSPGTNSIQIINEMYAYDTNNASGNGLIRIDNGYGDFPAFGGNNNFNIMIGVDILHGGGYTNIMDFTLIGDDPLYGSTPQNSSDVIAIGDSPLNGAVVTNWNHAIVIGENPLSGSTLANGSGIIAIGKRAGYGKDYTGKSHMVMIGDNANSTNSNDFVFGDNAYNYFFPGPTAHFDGEIITPQGTNLNSWAAIAPSAKQDALGFTPVNKAGETMTGPLSVTGLTNSARTASTFVVAGADKSDVSTATSATLAATLTDETGTGKVAFNTSPVFDTSITIGTGASAAGSVLVTNGSTSTVAFTINHASGASADLINANVGGTSKFKVTKDGALTAVNVINGGVIQTGGSGLLELAGRIDIASQAAGRVNIYNNVGGTNLTRITFGSENAGVPAIKMSGTIMQARLGDDSGDATFQSQGIPLYEGKVSTVTGIDVNQTAKTNLYTVPTGKNLVVTKIIVRNASTSLTTASFGFGFNANADDVVTSATHTELTGNTLYTKIEPKVGAIRGAAADIFGIKCTIAEGGAATVDVDVFGFFY